MPRNDKHVLRAAKSRLGALVDNKYRLVSLIGIGGMGIVYEAEHEVMRRRVALKILRPHYADKQKEFRRFLGEVRTVGALGHRTIVRVFDAGFVDGTTPYLVMERLVGNDLQQMIADYGHLSVRRVAWVGYEVLRGLDVAHAENVVHCDLKPANVFIHQTDEMDAPVVKLLDFGISTMTDAELGQESRSSKTRAAGTPYYMAPEQVRGNGVDPRTDLWAVGAILYEGLVGHQPFRAKTRSELFDKILHHEPIPLVKFDLQMVPQAFSDLVMSLLQKERDDRPSSARDVAAKLSELGLVDVQVWTSTHEGARPPRPQPYHTATFRRVPTDDD